MTEPVAVNAAAIIPQYLEGVGDGTKIILKNGEAVIDRRAIRTIVNKIATYYAIDLVELRKSYGEFVGQKNIIPLPFTEMVVLVPFKMRTPRAKNDLTFGYFNLCEIKDIRKDRLRTGQSYIMLTSGIEVPIMHVHRTARNHIMQGERILERFRQVHRLGDRNIAKMEAELADIGRMVRSMMPEFQASYTSDYRQSV